MTMMMFIKLRALIYTVYIKQQKQQHQQSTKHSAQTAAQSSTHRVAAVSSTAHITEDNGQSRAAQQSSTD